MCLFLSFKFGSRFLVPTSFLFSWKFVNAPFGCLFHFQNLFCFVFCVGVGGRRAGVH
jgi:hypothetical protein